jgi:carboxyl-terminal processing protease
VGLISFAFGYNTKRNPAISALQAKNTNEQISLSPELQKIYSKLQSEYDGEISSEDLNLSLKKGVVESAKDPYTVYFSPEEAKAFQSSLSGTFSGIGAELGQEGGQLIVIAPLDNSPAAAAGILPLDSIIQVNGENTEGWSVEKAVTKIRGEKGTPVTLKISRASGVTEITITRDDIKDPSVKTEILEGNIGYLRISRFGDDTSDLAIKAARDFKEKGVTGVILDLRNNGGGYLESSIDISSLWLDPGTVVLREKTKGIETKVDKASGTPYLKGIKTIVLTNGASASASEIVAGALQDNKAATLLGEKTFGKGSVQSPQPLEDGGLLKITIARWYTPNDKNIDKEGIKPDTELKQDTEALKSKVDNVKNKAAELLKN